MKIFKSWGLSKTISAHPAHWVWICRGQQTGLFFSLLLSSAPVWPGPLCGVVTVQSSGGTGFSVCWHLLFLVLDLWKSKPVCTFVAVLVLKQSWVYCLVKVLALISVPSIKYISQLMGHYCQSIGSGALENVSCQSAMYLSFMSMACAPNC